jgi:hypothetical protein
VLGFVEGDLDDMAAYPRLTDGEQLVGHGVPDGLQVHKCIREMYLMTFRPDGTADQRKAIKTTELTSAESPSDPRISPSGTSAPIFLEDVLVRVVTATA